MDYGEKKPSEFDNIIKLKIDNIANGRLGRIESALNRKMKEKINPIRQKAYGDPDLLASRKRRHSMDLKEDKVLNKTDIHKLLA